MIVKTKIVTIKTLNKAFHIIEALIWTKTKFSLTKIDITNKKTIDNGSYREEFKEKDNILQLNINIDIKMLPLMNK